MNKVKIKFTPYLACAYAEGFLEGEDATDAERIAAFQYLIDTGKIWTLQGWYGGTAIKLIEAGLCHKNYKGVNIKEVK